MKQRILEATHIFKTFTDHKATAVLTDINFCIYKGEFVSVIGKSGCGKSTLLNILGLLDDPDAGSFQFNGIEV